MQYISTRGEAPKASFTDVLLAALARDGGLYVPESWPRLPAATIASLALVYALRRGNSPRWLLWGFVAFAFAGFAAMLPVSAAFVGTSMATFSRLMLFGSWI